MRPVSSESLSSLTPPLREISIPDLNCCLRRKLGPHKHLKKLGTKGNKHGQIRNVQAQYYFEQLEKAPVTSDAASDMGENENTDTSTHDREECLKLGLSINPTLKSLL